VVPVERSPLDAERLRSFGERVRQLRVARKLSQEDLAHDAGLHRSVVGYIEQGRREVGLLTLWPLAEALNVGVGDLFGP
jgi:transcriptional regulator with XRE-family HTH domain